KFYSNKAKCIRALAEISDDNGNYIITKNSLEPFFKHYLPLYIDLFHLWNFRAFHRFRHLFFLLVNWIEYYKIGPKTKAALHNLNPYHEDDIEDWLIEHDRLYYCNGI